MQQNNQKINWPKIWFYGDKDDQNRVVLCTGQQGSGKTHIVMQFIEDMCSKKKSQIFVLSSVHDSGLDKETSNKLKQYHTQIFGEKDLRTGILTELLNYLKAKEQPKSKKKKFIQNVLIVDDILLNISNQRELLLLCKIYRHINLTIFMLSQDFVQSGPMTLRNMANVFVLFPGPSLYRLKQNIYQSLRSDINFEYFKKLFRDATSQPFTPLIIDNKRSPAFFQISNRYIYDVNEGESE